jgi:ACS family tartrate transporter-like MFS transporter
VTDLDPGPVTMRRVSLRLLPFLFSLYIFAYLDRTNVSFAALQMNDDLKFSSAVFGFGAGIFFLGYALFEVPSNMILARVGARLWIARIAITWGLLACAMMWVRTPLQFYAARFLLGVAEAGLFPGVIYFLGQWFPSRFRARAIAAFVIAIPLSGALGGPVSGALLQLDGVLHLAGWQWLFLIEGLPAILLGFTVLGYLPDRPADVRWLSLEQRNWLSHRLELEQQVIAAAPISPLSALATPLVWVLAVPYFIFYAIGLVYQLWGPILVRDALGTTNVGTGMIIGGISLGCALTYPLAAALSDRWDERCGLVALALATDCIGCIGVAILPHSPLRIAALALIPFCNGMFLTSFWCLPTKFLRGSSAAAGIALINAIGSSGGFFGPSIVGFLKNSTGSDSGAFFGLAGLAIAGVIVCTGLRRRPEFKRGGAMLDAGLLRINETLR